MRHLKFLIFPFFIFFLIGCKKDKDPIQPQDDSSEMTDTRDGQKYKICKINNQWWMAENLNYYIPTGSWYYNNDSITYSKPCGRLYLWNVAMVNHASSGSNPSGVQGISPPGWHIPSYDEWKQLEEYLTTQNMNGDDLKETGLTHWPAPNTGTNKTLFNAVPAGTVYGDGNAYVYANIDYQTTFLTSTIDNRTGGVWGFGLDRDKSIITNNPIGLQNGWSIRCVKD